MTSVAKTPKGENAFGSFAIGVAIGVGAALLFGTEEGRKLSHKLFDSLPEKLKNLTDTTEYPPESSPYSPESTIQESTPHHYTYQNEPPPPAAPHVIPTLPRSS